MRQTCLLITLLFAFALPALAGHHEDRAAIEAAVFDYFHGQGEASHERLLRAFVAEHATMVGVSTSDDGEDKVASYKDMQPILERWGNNDNPPGGDRDGEILELKVVDGRLAVVLFRSADVFYDALTLAKVNGDWKIIQKAFIRQ